MTDISYLAWRIESKQPVEREVAAAIARFEQRFGRRPTELLIPLGGSLSWPGLEVRERRNIPAQQVWVGADLTDPQTPTAPVDGEPSDLSDQAPARRIA